MRSIRYILLKFHIPVVASVATIMCLLSQGCSSTPAPDNLEPIIETLEATGITRTEATLTVRIHKRSATSLTRLEFHYGEEENPLKGEIMTDPNSEIHILNLRDLKPGTTYHWLVEAGTATATIRTETKSFTTEPTEPPSVSDITLLSTGPTGVILSFDVPDDGGAPLKDVGCKVYSHATGEISRISADQVSVENRPYRIYVRGLAVETTYTLTPYATNDVGESDGGSLDYTTGNSIVLKEAGSLSYLFEDNGVIDLEELSISGDMNGDDFKFLRALLGAPAMPEFEGIRSRVESVDISDVNIAEGGGTYDGRHYISAGTLSTGLFADCGGLRQISLPVTATRIDRDAFASCQLLECVTIPAGVSRVLPSADCPSLKSINTSEANLHFVSIDGVLYNRDVTEIIWFPTGKTGNYELPGGISTIGENAFYGTQITGLIVPESVVSISRGAFAGSSLTEISFPGNLRNISEGMLQNCASLRCVRLGKDTEYIGAYAFSGTNIDSLYIAAPVPPFTVTDAFAGCVEDIFEKCTLYVLPGCRDIYSRHHEWGRFKKIEEY